MGENYCELVENKIFTGKNFVDCSLVLPKDTMPSNFIEKTFTNSHKTLKFTKPFSFEGFPLFDIATSNPIQSIIAIL